MHGRIVLATLTFISISANAALEEGDFINYDQIVRDLSRDENPAPVTRTRWFANDQSDPLDSSTIHLGLGVCNIFGTVVLPDQHRTYLNNRGVQVALGIDLMSENWMAEGTVRSIGDNEYANNGLSLKEFDLKFYFKSRLASGLSAKIGTGLSARYLRLQRNPYGEQVYTTPSALATAGFDVYASPHLSFGAEGSYRSTMVADTIDRDSYDITVRADTHF